MASLIHSNRVFLWIFGFTLTLLSIPLIAMQITNEVRWSSLDFILMGFLISGFCSAFVLAARKYSNLNRYLLAGVFILLFIYFWFELAVGLLFNIGS